MRRVTAYAALGLALLVVPAGAALADDDVIPLDPSITALDPSITPLETVTTEDSRTEIALSSDILFDVGSAELDAPASARIGELVAEIPRGAEVAVDGHTDSIPYARGNQVLSEERAQAVADAIAAARPDLRLTVTGYGDTRPVADEEVDGQDDPAGRAQNRRVEIRYDG
ncbi:OmpA/MotB family protein [Brachybacterium hainanense]|uniref:Flagellar motor protein MotB n=1 Tax=Brachybacterium hainanense TaxID=1541174 RepID=A0ABV6REK2_9MICO